MAADSEFSEEIPNMFFKKQRLDDASSFTSSKGKGKMKANDDILQRILSTYEDEITCPMYVSLFSFIIANPEK